MNMIRYSTLLAILFVVTIGFFVSACDDFLNEPPRGSLSPDVLANSQGVETLLIGAYSALNPVAGWQGTGGIGGGASWEVSPDNWVYGTVVGGDAKKGSDASDQPPINQLMLGEVVPTNNFLDNKWKAGYEGIARTNEVITVANQAGDMSEAERIRAIAEARFLRGHFYFDLKKMFNMIPWIDEDTDDFRQPNDQDIWPNIEADFQYAMENLPETQADVGRANSWAAASYLAKTYVYQEKWSEAKSLYDDIITQGQTSNGLAYELAPQFYDNFNPATQNNSESVFAVQMTADDGTGGIAHSRSGSMLNYPYSAEFRCCGFLQPSQDLVNTFQTEDGLPMIGGHNQSMVGWDQGVPSAEPFDVHEGTLDPRLDWTVGRRGVPYLNWGPHPGRTWVRDQAYAGPYHAQKHIYARGSGFENPNSWAPGSAVNHHVIRFADVLLMAAETEANLGNLEAARSYVNRVRERAQNPDGWVRNEHNEEYAVATVTSEAELAGVDASVGEWVVNTSDSTTHVLIASDTWQAYPDPTENYDIALYEDAWNSADEALNAIRYERRLELAMEGNRLFDLVRWDIAVDELNRYYAFEGDLTPDVRGGSFRERNRYFPIPQRQIDLSTVGGEPTLQQNPGY